MYLNNNTQYKEEKQYVVHFIVGLFIFSCLIFFYKRTDLFPWIGDCSSRGFDAESFMAYCHSRRYGDYEHRAYLEQLEPDLIKNVKNADVLFLGNSRAQYAFSTHAVADYFAETELIHYNFGFGMGSQNYVPEQLAIKYSISPSVLIINADPFFTDYVSQTNKNMLKNSRSTIWQYQVKGWLQTKQRELCADRDRAKDWPYSMLCQGNQETLFRNRIDGHWNVNYYRKQKAIPVAIDTLADSKISLQKATDIAERFFKVFNIAKECVVLTVTPQASTPMNFANLLAEKLQVAGIFPYSDQLRTIDYSHLDSQSAEWWSSQVLNAATPLINRCTIKPKN